MVLFNAAGRHSGNRQAGRQAGRRAELRPPPLTHSLISPLVKQAHTNSRPILPTAGPFFPQQAQAPHPHPPRTHSTPPQSQPKFQPGTHSLISPLVKEVQAELVFGIDDPHKQQPVLLQLRDGQLRDVLVRQLQQQRKVCGAGRGEGLYNY